MRSKLRMSKEQEAIQQLRVAESLRSGTRSARAKAREDEMALDKIGAQLAGRFSREVVNPLKDFTRPLKSRNAETIKLAYAMHLFGNYPVPTFIQRSFLQAYQKSDRVLNAVDRISLNVFFALRRGKSVWKVVTKSFLSKRETHDLVNIRQDFTMREAIVFAIALQDCERGRAHVIAKSRINELFTLEGPFWREVIRFFGRNACTRQEMNDILDYLRARDHRTYSLKGRTIKTLLRAHEEWVREAARVKELGDHTWSGINVSDLIFTTREGKHEWHIFQIKDSKELGREGTSQRHCVSSYRPYCQSGQIGIFSLRRRDRQPPESQIPYDRALTIEVSREGKIRQVRGFANRAALAYEDEAVHYWAAQNGMNYNPRSMY